MSKFGFVYIWFDNKRKMYYIGCHWGSPDDGYICSSRRMRDVYRRRPENFKRRILSVITTNHRDLFMEEQRWLYMIPDNQLGKKYYNLRKCIEHWRLDENKTLSVAEKISKAKLGKPPWNKGKTLSPEHNIACHAWAKGRIAWNKGKSGVIKQSEETKEKIRQLMLKNNPFKGRKHTQESIEKNRQAHLGKIPWNKGKRKSINTL